MLFFVLFALCFAQETTTQYCYMDAKDKDGNVVGYNKIIKEGSCPEGFGDKNEDPELSGDYVCKNTLSKCPADGAKLNVAVCIQVGKCPVVGGGSMKYTVKDNKVTVTEYSSNNCDESSTGKESNDYECDKCDSNLNEQYKCPKPSTNDNNGGDATKKEYCYMDAKDKDGKVVGYNKMVKQQGSCPEGFTAKNEDPKLDGDYVCKNTLSKCPADGAELNVAVCVQFGKCPVASSGSMKYTIKDKEVTETEYSSNNCDESSTGKESSKHKCDECSTDNNEQYKCYVKKDKDDGAFETAILLVIAFIFFLF